MHPSASNLFWLNICLINICVGVFALAVITKPHSAAVVYIHFIVM